MQVSTFMISWVTDCQTDLIHVVGELPVQVDTEQALEHHGHGHRKGDAEGAVAPTIDKGWNTLKIVG